MAGVKGRSGRKRGSRADLATKGALEVFRYYEFDPLSALISELESLKDVKGDAARRDRIAISKELMKYRHPALSTITHKGDDDSPLTVTVNYGKK